MGEMRQMQSQQLKLLPLNMSKAKRKEAVMAKLKIHVRMAI